ncbi:hypothetical protein IE077_004358 [Cardiosporidium cionae]|uniref:Macro domain-containing protein n=1 Tax=Cardiosporidium cionae TaxID=476202 RepID=A0ABQ7JBI9_9APIC|nr:hypothetical protein IE077_004358 [Cardiosporidium cionae]|eukprot:KAF8821310.1 hypothetical protein IE077_004358 [Cardiosporidium cionae]
MSLYPSSADLLPAITKALNPEYKGVLKTVDFEHFGSISAVHDDVLRYKADCLIIPMASNLLPYRGLGLRIMEQGGPQLSKVLYSSTRNILKQRQTVHPQNYSAKGKRFHLSVGDVLLAPSFNISESVTVLAFLVMPYFWQGSPLQSARQLRYALKTALKFLNKNSISSIALPHIGNGLYGFSPADSAHLLYEECTEALLQLEEEIPLYNIQSISIVDEDNRTAEILYEALKDVERTWIPEEQVIPSTLYWKKQSQRIIEVSPRVLRWCKKHNKVSFKKYHSIPRRRALYWRMNLLPFIWRPARVLTPSSLMVKKLSGYPSTHQNPPKAFYYRGVSHQLFPVVRPGFPSMRITQRGRFVGVNRHPRITNEIKPRN